MKHPEYYDKVKKITMYDPLSEFLGAYDDGMIEYTYQDAVNLAGHSCPTVAGAYLLTLKALEILYPNATLPVRGEIEVLFGGHKSDGVVGVIANIASLITGASDEAGFKGINGNFSRCGLLLFNQNINGTIKFKLKNSDRSVELVYNASAVPPHEDQNKLMQLMINNSASKEQRSEFAMLWQSRVKRILIDEANNPKLIQIV